MMLLLRKHAVLMRKVGQDPEVLERMGGEYVAVCGFDGVQCAIWF